MDAINGLEPVRAERILDSDLSSKISSKDREIVDGVYYGVPNKGSKKE